MTAKAAARASRAARTRYYISFSYRPAVLDQIRTPGRLNIWRRAVWPILFKSEDEAWAYMKSHNVFANADPIPGVRGRLLSSTVKSVVLAERVEP